MPTSRKATWFVIAAIGVTIAGSYRFKQLLADPNIVLLVGEQNAEWIGVNEPFSFRARPVGIVAGRFRTSFHIRSIPPNSVLTLRALKSATVFLDGNLLCPGQERFDDWKTARHVDLSGRISLGTHVIEVVVRNDNGPVGLLMYSESLGLATNGTWEASGDGAKWSAAKRLAELRLEPLSRRFPRTDQAIVKLLPFLVPLFAATFVLSLWFQHAPPQIAWLRWARSPTGVRWILALAWIALALNNIHKTPARLGFDVRGHVEYVDYVATNARIPFANEGWQMFQSPLYYMLLAPCYKLLSALLPPQSVWIWRLLRLVSVACGVTQIELCFRMLKLICPDREDLQVLGTTLGAALPMNIYISQTVGNEPMAGCFTAVAVVFAMKLLCVTGSTASAVNWRVIGLFLGLAMLTKVTAVLLFPVFVIALWYVFVRDGRTLKQTAVAWLEVFGIALAVSGWYYVRNWIVLGRPFVGGWEPGRGIDWWQSPGYRVPGHFLRFGASLIYPIYSGVSGLWDSLYSTFWLDGWLSSAYLFESRPPWNYDWMVAGSVLAAVPSLAIIVGGVVAICCPAPRCAAALRFAVGCVATYLLALAALYLQLPIFSTAKATYTLGLLPCYVALGAIGFGSLMRGPLSRAAISAWMVCWACSAYLAFFVH